MSTEAQNTCSHFSRKGDEGASGQEMEFITRRAGARTEGRKDLT
jgi:hypothetical protein